MSGRSRRATGRSLRLAAAVAVVATLSAVLLELMLLAVEPWLSGPFVYDPRLGFRYRPLYDGANRLGFNDVERSPHKPPGTFRFLVLGDSYNWAGGRSGNYTARLERRFEAEYGAQVVEVMNVGLHATHTAQQLELLEAAGLDWQPDVVVLGFFAGNDFFDAVPHRRRILIGGGFVDLDPRRDFEWVLFGRPIVPRSRLAAWIHHAAVQLRESVTGADQALAPATYFDIKRRYLGFYDPATHRQGRFDTQIAYIFASIDALKRRLDGAGIGLLVAILPDELSVDDDLASAVFARFGLNAADFDLNLAQRLLADRLQTRRIRYVDLTPAMRAAQEREPMYLVRDGHWNLAGNQAAADALFPHMRRIVEQHRSTHLATGAPAPPGPGAVP